VLTHARRGASEVQVDLATGERCDGPVFLTEDERRLDRHGAGRIVGKVARRAGITKPVGPHTLDTHSSPPPWTPACRCATFRRPPPTLTRGPRSATTGPAGAWTGTPRISSRPTSLALPGTHTA
jgi:hypothetical protein